MIQGEYVLAIDTATDVASVALHDGQRVLAETTWRARLGHSRWLVQEVQRLFERTEAQPSGVAGIAVAAGPGSFTGVRIGLSVAKGLAVGWDVPLWPVNTLDVLVRLAPPTDLPVRAVVGIGRNRVATALYRGGAAEGAMEGVASQALPMLVHEPQMLIGDVPEDVRPELEQRGAVVLDALLTGRRGAALADLGWRHLRAGNLPDAARATAVYLPPVVRG